MTTIFSGIRANVAAALVLAASTLTACSSGPTTSKLADGPSLPPYECQAGYVSKPDGSRDFVGRDALYLRVADGGVTKKLINVGIVKSSARASLSNEVLIESGSFVVFCHSYFVSPKNSTSSRIMDSKSGGVSL